MNHDLIYHTVCPDENCNADYVGESARRLEERLKDHNVRDINSHMLKHSGECEHGEFSRKVFCSIHEGN